jgi:hypothetical protein
VVGGYLEDAPSTAIVTFDDDMLVGRTVAASLLSAAAEWPDAALGLSGWNARYSILLALLVQKYKY